MSHKNQLITGIIITAVIAGGGMFYAGMQYEKSSLSKQGLLRDQGSQFGGGNRQPGQGGPARQFGGVRGGGPNGESSDFEVGQIISKEDKSITVKAQDGSTKIVYFSDSTTIGKTENGSPSDLNTGVQVVANGKLSPDGSLTAQNIQIRPAPQN